MTDYIPHLNWIRDQHQIMVALLETWANINSGSENIEGLKNMMYVLKNSFSALDGKIQEVELPPNKIINSKGEIIKYPVGKGLLITKHPKAPIKILLNGHMDTVYSKDSDFQQAKFIDENTLNGPGVTDMKGGLVVMLKALEAFERSPYAGKIGWSVFINSDEEIGSHGSEEQLHKLAKKHDLGLIFEPTYPDGTLISSRKGSSAAAVIVRGKAAHAGRNFHEGNNAIAAIAPLIQDIAAMTDPSKGITVNIGHIEGGGPLNIVADLAIVRINLRTERIEDLNLLYEELGLLIETYNELEEGNYRLHKLGDRPPKTFDSEMKQLYEQLKSCAEILKQPLRWKPSGGATDGNILASEGLYTIDCLGVTGGEIHTNEEYINLNSLTEKASLTALFLMKIANNEINLPKKGKK